MGVAASPVGGRNVQRRLPVRAGFTIRDPIPVACAPIPRMRQSAGAGMCVGITRGVCLDPHGAAVHDPWPCRRCRSSDGRQTQHRRSADPHCWITAHVVGTGTNSSHRSAQFIIGTGSGGRYISDQKSSLRSRKLTQRLDLLRLVHPPCFSANIS